MSTPRKSHKIQHDRILGKGKTGMVFYGTDSNGNAIAVKVISGVKSSDAAKLENEIDTLKNLRHNNFIQVTEFDKIARHGMASNYYIMMELADDDLQKILDDPKKTAAYFNDINDIKRFMTQMIDVGLYLSNEKRPYLDLDLKHILVCGKYTWKLAADTSIAKVLNKDDLDHLFGEVKLYNAPEIISASPGDEGKLNLNKCAVFSMGLVFLRVLGIEKIDGYNDKFGSTEGDIAKTIATIEDKYKDPAISSILKKMLTVDPTNRSDFQQLNDQVKAENSFTNVPVKIEIKSSNSLMDSRNGSPTKSVQDKLNKLRDENERLLEENKSLKEELETQKQSKPTPTEPTKLSSGTIAPNSLLGAGSSMLKTSSTPGSNSLGFLNNINTSQPTNNPFAMNQPSTGLFAQTGLFNKTTASSLSSGQDKSQPQVVEKIVEKIVYVDRPVEKIVERIVEKPVEKIVEKIVYAEKPAEKTASNPFSLGATTNPSIGLLSLLTPTDGKKAATTNSGIGLFGNSLLNLNDGKKETLLNGSILNSSTSTISPAVKDDSLEKIWSYILQWKNTVGVEFPELNLTKSDGKLSGADKISSDMILNELNQLKKIVTSTNKENKVLSDSKKETGKATSLSQFRFAKSDFNNVIQF